MIKMTIAACESVKDTNISNENKTVKKGGKYLTFYLGDEEYGIEILKVREIIGFLVITPIPKVPKFIKGFINLRGKIIPILDLRLKLSMQEAAHTEKTCIIVVKANDIELGIIVDKVSEVANIDNNDIEDTPCFGERVDTDYILGIGRSGDKVKILLDINKVISTKDVIDIKQAEKPANQINQK
ncbi:purine-binding chemotaxis protein CheW [Candidatus Desantisbacteria bacterium]|nr:purine-binding chemotaxis protein CheW [Candidatus Desantisbacteria bacterium]